MDVSMKITADEVVSRVKKVLPEEVLNTLEVAVPIKPPDFPPCKRTNTTSSRQTITWIDSIKVNMGRFLYFDKVNLDAHYN